MCGPCGGSPLLSEESLVPGQPAGPLLTSRAAALQPWGTVHALANACGFPDRPSILRHLFAFVRVIPSSTSTVRLLYLIPADLPESGREPQGRSLAGLGVLFLFLQSEPREVSAFALS